MKFQAPDSLSEQIAQHVGQHIIKGVLKPGERIQELRIAGELGVSRGSIREALLILERRHLIRIYPRKGAVVSQLTPELINGLYDIYIRLLIMLAEKVAERWQASDLQVLMSQVACLQQQVDRPDRSSEAIVAAGFDVMRACYPIVANQFLQETLENFRPAISRTYYLSMERSGSEAAQTRVFIIDLMAAVQKRNARQISQVVQDFGEHQRCTVLGVLEQIPGAVSRTDKTG